MNQKKITYQITKPHLILFCILGLLVLTISIHFFITSLVFSEIGKTFFVDVPGRSGGATYYLDRDEFTTVSTIAMGVVAALFIGAGILVRLKKALLKIAVVTLIVATVVAFYGAIILGNGFHDIWGGWWSVVGVLLAFGVILALELPLLRSVLLSRNQK